MAIAIIICVTLIVIVTILCVTEYRLKNNSELEKLYNKVNFLADEVNDNNKYFLKYCSEVNDYRREMKELIDLPKDKTEEK